MDFSLSDEQALVRDTARALLQRECTLEVVRATWDDRAAAAPLWQKHLSQWLGLADAGLVEIMLFMTEYGRAATPGVFFDSLLATQIASLADLALEGSATVAVSGPDGLWSPHPDPVKHFVGCAGDVDEIVFVGGSPRAPTLAVVPRAGAACHEVEQMDRLRPTYRVELEAEPAGTAIDPAAWQDAVERALVTSASELIGVGHWLVDAAVEHAKQRVQFDVPIGSFQGLQWMMVDAALELERAAAAVSYAAMCVDADDADRHRAVHGAKAEAGLAARHAARMAMQVHGGVGYTFEHGLHFWLRRAYSGDAFMGPSAHHHDRLAALLFDA